MTTFEELLTEAEQQPFSGWDFAWLNNRWEEHKVSWDYRQKILAQFPSAATLLDMGTGGGEFLASLPTLPAKTFATESYTPNVALAKTRLGALGIEVIETGDDEKLPFSDIFFDLVINRHESFSAQELYRIIRHGGCFIIQQVGGKDNIRLNELLQTEATFEYSYWDLAYATNALKSAGFQIVEQIEEFPTTVFYDVGALVYYLKAVPWQIEDFSVEKYYAKLKQIHQMIEREGSLVITSHRFYLKALK
jgi:SAM-dependent methyltransferase